MNMCNEEDLFEAMDEEYLEDVKIKTKNIVEEEDFVNSIRLHPCLMDKSQTPPMKTKKNAAILEMIKYFKSNNGIDISAAQIKKKIENMKSRVKQKADKTKTGNFKIKLKAHEQQLLHLMDFRNNPVVNKIPGACQIGIAGSSKDCEKPIENQALEEDRRCEPQFAHVAPPKRKKNGDEHCLVLQLQREVLEQQKELNNQQKEIFVLQKEKLLLEIDI